MNEVDGERGADPRVPEVAPTAAVVTRAPRQRSSSPSSRFGSALPGRSEVIPWALLALPMGLWLLALWPAVMTNDSIDMLTQAIEGPVVRWHPPLYTTLLGYSWSLSGSPVLLAVAQVIAMAWVLRRVLGVAVRAGLAPPLAYGFGVLLCSLPPVGAFVVHVWKDVPYVIGFLMILEWFLARAAGPAGDARAVSRGSDWARLAAGFALVLLMRPNGLLVAAAVAPAVLWLGRRQLRSAIVTMVGAGLAYVAITWIIYPVLSVAPPPPELQADLAIFDLAAVAQHDPGGLSPRTADALEELAPLEDFATGHNCHWSGSTFDREVLYAPDPDMAALGDGWAEEVLDDPLLLIGNHLCAASAVWNPVPSVEERTSQETVHDGIIANDLGAVSDPVSDRLGSWMRSRIADSNTSTPAQVLLWRSATWTWVLAALLVVAAVRRKSSRCLVPMIPLLAQAASVVAIFGPHYRYGAPAWIGAVAALPTAVALIARSERSADVGAGALEPSEPDLRS